MVNGPSRPMYMTATSKSLAAGPNPVVIPVDKPTVPNADVISNRISINPSPGSSTHMAKEPAQTTSIDNVLTTAAL